MKQARCPVCGAQQFFVKDPEDQYNIAAFQVDSGAIIYETEEADADRIRVGNDSEVFCEKCAWHDTFLVLQKS